MLLSWKRSSRLWRIAGAPVFAQARGYGTKGNIFMKRMMDNFYEYQESLQNPDLITFLQRSKNILSSQWRCQLVTSSTAAKRDEKLHASIVQYAFLQKPYICLTNKDKIHKTDLVLDSNATVYVGHTDPPALMETIKLLGKVPPHVLLTGVMAFAEDSEVNKVKEEIGKINSAAKEVVEIGGQALGPLFETAKELLNTQFEARANLFTPENEANVYLFRPRLCQYVDLTGEKHEVDILDGLSPSIDGFSTLYAGLIEGINQSEARRFALKVFCMVYRHVKVEEALLYSIDRKGFDVFVKIVKGVHTEWKGYRFNFQREVRDALGVCRQLVEMESECWEIMRKSPALASLVSKAAAPSTPTVAVEHPSPDDEEHEVSGSEGVSEGEGEDEADETEASNGLEEQQASVS